MNYHFCGEEDLDSPSLVYYQNIIEENIDKAIALAGNADRLWPHMKSHKMAAVLKLQIERGIKRFKCATVAEAELCAMAGSACVLLAYPLVGPAINRFVKLRALYNETDFWAIGDNLEQLRSLGKAAAASGNGSPVSALVDVNLGMNRTGVPPGALEDFYLNAIKIEGLAIKGFHCYDGHLGIADIEKRRAAVSLVLEKFLEVKNRLEKQGYEIPVLVMGGTPTFACHRETSGVYLSPGTFFVQDYGYSSKYTDLDFSPGAAILSRVISHPEKNLFTLDTGTKAIAADPADRGIIADLPRAKPLFQSEEHWVWRLDEGSLPPVGTVVYIIPAHICPTTALYPGAFVVKNGKPVNYWKVGARNRKITV